MKLCSVGFGSLVLLVVQGIAGADDGARAIRFGKDVRPILSDKCFQCHGPDEAHREADLRLDLEHEAKASAIVAGDVDSSELIARVTTSDPELVMPPPAAKKPLTTTEIQTLTSWIAQGASWTDHWAFRAPKRPELPEPADPAWCRNPIDFFILRRMRQEGMTPNAPADRNTLIRRLSFDLRGLPPTPQEVRKFLEDSATDAYERLVDRLLASPQYGERMALLWLDAARYGDTSVFHADGPRDMWAWRDLVIRSYNRNQPFDKFTRDQLAGDLIPNATVEQLVAAGFNRNNGTTDEGGAIAEEYRVEYAVDRVKTTATVWLGLTMECSQCHDHKYDPISQTDYYRFFAFFNVSADTGMQTRNGNSQPTVDVPDPENERRLPGVRQQLVATTSDRELHRSAAEPQFQEWTTALANELQEQPDSALPKNPLYHFELDGAAEDKLVDSIDAEREAKVQGKRKWESARFGQGFRFDGGTFLDLGQVADFERDQAFSYGGWVNPDDSRTGAILARMDNNNGFRGYDLLLSDGHVEVHIIHKWPENAIKIRTKKQLQAKQWQHVFATYDGKSKAEGAKIYVNGELWECDVQQNGLTDTIRTDKTLLFGSRHPDSRLKGVLDEIYCYPRELSEAEITALATADPIAPILRLAAEERTAEQVEQLREHFFAHVDADYQSLSQRIAELTSLQEELSKPLTTVMTMKDMAQPRETFILARGQYNSPTKTRVERGTPSILPPMPSNLPASRLGLAKWLFQPDHPLTARVAVNRYWQMLFGRGLVGTPEDFGSQGEFPTHPALLDWLAVDFRESGWDVKHCLKQIVMSATYRQASAAESAKFEQDPENSFLARGSHFRLQGEFIRDNALQLSGLLVSQMGGPGVKPYQPPGLWAEVGLSGKPNFVQDHGRGLYRRSIYTYWKRSAPHPALSIFDAPTREKCAVRRARTNTPLQALVTLNDVQFVEAARQFAKRMAKEGGDTREARIRFGYLAATSRFPTEAETQTLLQLYKDALDFYQSDTNSAESLLAFGESATSADLQPVEHAAWTVVASSILNLDETLTKR